MTRPSVHHTFGCEHLSSCSRGGTKTKLGGKCSERNGDLCKVMIREENDEEAEGEQVQFPSLILGATPDPSTQLFSRNLATHKKPVPRGRCRLHRTMYYGNLASVTNCHISKQRTSQGRLFSHPELEENLEIDWEALG